MHNIRVFNCLLLFKMPWQRDWTCSTTVYSCSRHTFSSWVSPSLTRKWWRRRAWSTTGTEWVVSSYYLHWYVADISMRQNKQRWTVLVFTLPLVPVIACLVCTHPPTWWCSSDIVIHGCLVEVSILIQLQNILLTSKVVFIFIFFFN